MDTSNPAVFVNAELLRMHVGRRVRAAIQVLRSDGGGSVLGKSTDEQQLVIKGHLPAPLTTFVEVIGVADTNQSTKAEIWTKFGDALDTSSYNGDFKHLSSGFSMMLWTRSASGFNHTLLGYLLCNEGLIKIS